VQPHGAPGTHAQLGPQVQPSPQEHADCVFGISDWQPHVQVAPAQDAQVHLLGTFVAVDMVTSSGMDRMFSWTEEVCVKSARRS
jgi:hypothetical protein